MNKEKKDILWRIYLVYAGIFIFAITIVVQLCRIQFVHGSHWKEVEKGLTVAKRDIKAVRGNIYAADGSLLATSVPVFQVRFDPNADAISDKIFFKDVDSLSYCLSQLFKDKSPKQYKMDLVDARKAGERYYLIQRNVKYTDLQTLKNFPLFRKGRYKGGLIAVQQNTRVHPFGKLALRTIGYDRKDVNPVGLEGAYSEALAGMNGQRLMKKIAGGIWMPLDDNSAIEPREGSDIYTTIDVNIQDVAEHALLTQLEKQKADHGCVVVMEVKTGKVKAIANLTIAKDSTYYEGYNYAVGASTEPGSVFKLASLTVAMDDGRANLKSKVDIGNGVTKYYNLTMKDADHAVNGVISLEKAFEVSSNVGVSKIIYRSYSKDPQRFVDRLCKMGLNRKLGVVISGEGQPLIKNPSDATWSGTTLPWMAIGYEVRLTPLQILTFYNAVANDGKEVKPMFVNKIMYRGKLIKQFNTTVLNPAIASKQTIEEDKQMLEGVVQDGTAKSLSHSVFKIAGKTGTAQIANAKYGYHYDSKVSYHSTFVGYFPANHPKYSCIVVVNAPSGGEYYASHVACPIFKAVADKIYAQDIKLQQPINQRQDSVKNNVPVSKDGDAKDLKDVFAQLDLKISQQDNNNKWVETNTQSTDVKTTPLPIIQNLVPNVIGMGVQDAIYLLENMGLQVKFTGYGVVGSQSIAPGTRINNGETIALTLNT